MGRRWFQPVCSAMYWHRPVLLAGTLARSHLPSATRWLHVFKTLVCTWLIDPGKSEWRLHRKFGLNKAAMGS